MLLHETMSTDPLERIGRWALEEVLDLVKKGATEADLAERTFWILAVQRAFEKHRQEISEDRELREAMILYGLQNGDPHGLRQIAALLRERKDFDLAYRFEMQADRKERGEI